MLQPAASCCKDLCCLSNVMMCFLHAPAARTPMMFRDCLGALYSKKKGAPLQKIYSTFQLHSIIFSHSVWLHSTNPCGPILSQSGKFLLPPPLCANPAGGVGHSHRRSSYPAAPEQLPAPLLEERHIGMLTRQALQLCPETKSDLG